MYTYVVVYRRYVVYMSACTYVVHALLHRCDHVLLRRVRCECNVVGIRWYTNWKGSDHVQR